MIVSSLSLSQKPSPHCCWTGSVGGGIPRKCCPCHWSSSLLCPLLLPLLWKTPPPECCCWTPSMRCRTVDCCTHCTACEALALHTRTEIKKNTHTHRNAKTARLLVLCCFLSSVWFHALYNCNCKWKEAQKCWLETNLPLCIVGKKVPVEVVISGRKGNLKETRKTLLKWSRLWMLKYIKWLETFNECCSSISPAEAS